MKKKTARFEKSQRGIALGCFYAILVCVIYLGFATMLMMKIGLDNLLAYAIVAYGVVPILIYAGIFKLSGGFDNIISLVTQNEEFSKFELGEKPKKVYLKNISGAEDKVYYARIIENGDIQVCAKDKKGNFIREIIIKQYSIFLRIFQTGE